MGEEIKKEEIGRSHRLGAPKNNCKTDQLLWSLQDITPDLEFSKRKKLKGKSINVTAKFDEKTYGSP